VLRWSEIAGPTPPALRAPLKLTDSPAGGVLTLKAEPAPALFFSTRAERYAPASTPIRAGRGRRLKFVQGPLASPLPAAPRGGPVDPPPPTRAALAGPAQSRSGPSQSRRQRTRGGHPIEAAAA